MDLRVRLMLMVVLVLVAWGCGGGNAAMPQRELLVGSSGNGKILRYDAVTGAYKGVFASGGPLVSPNGLGQLTNGHVVVGDFVTHHLLEYSSDGTFLADLGALDGIPFGLLPLKDGGFLVSEFQSEVGNPDPRPGRVVKYTAANGFETFAQGGELDGPDGLVVGPDGSLYVSSENSAEVLKYDLSGHFLGVFASGSPLGAPNAGPSGLAFGPDGNLYVAQHDTNPIATTNGMVLRYNGQTGAFIDQVVPEGSGGLSGPVGVTFSVDNRLLVTSAATNQVLSYSSNGTFAGVFASGPDLIGPIYMAPVLR